MRPTHQSLGRVEVAGRPRHDVATSTIRKRTQQTFDHRLRDVVGITGDASIAAGFGVPRSTIRGWLRGDYQLVTSAGVFEMDPIHLQFEVLMLRERNRELAAVIRLLNALLRALGIRLDQRRLISGAAKARLLHAIDRAQQGLPLRGVLHVLGLSPSRYRRWRRLVEFYVAATQFTDTSFRIQRADAR